MLSHRSLKTIRECGFIDNQESKAVLDQAEAAIELHDAGQGLADYLATEPNQPFGLLAAWEIARRTFEATTHAVADTMRKASRQTSIRKLLEE